MCYRCLRWLLMVVGLSLLTVAVVPFMALLHIHAPWETAFVAAKLTMLPVGALCLIGASMLTTHLRRR